MNINYSPPGKVARKFHAADNFVRGLMGPVGCLPGDTEYLTPTGWKRIDQWTSGDLVGVWRDGEVFFEEADYVKLPSDYFYRFDSGSLVMELSPEHRVLALDWKGELVVKTAESLAHRPSRHTIITTFALSRADADISDHEIRMRVMFSADGHIPAAGGQVCVAVRKQRKRERLEWLLAEGSFSLSVYDRGVPEYSYRFRWPYGEPEKSLDFVWSLSSRQLAIVLDEAMHWDGLHGHKEKRFHTTVKANADAIQFAAHACGYRATVGVETYENGWKPLYRVYIRTSDNAKNRAMVRGDSTNISTFESEDGFKYCFTTSTGFFVVRCQGSVFVTGNSGKSSSCCVEVVARALKQRPFNGVRRSRWAIIRNTYPELKSTTIKTWESWFPSEVAPIRWDTPITSTMNIADIGDGTSLELEVLFLALDRPTETGKLRSLELTGAWVNEASEIPKEIFDMVTQRVGRYPSKIQGGPSWTGVILDTNPPDDDHWYYKFAEEVRPPEWQFFRQPGALIKTVDGDDVDFSPNPEAENIFNLELGYQYYLNQVAGKNDDWISVFLLGNYGTTADGKPVYPEFKDKVHTAPAEIEPIQGLPIILGWDFGLTPACVVAQLSPRGQLIVLREYVSEDMGIRQFANEVVKPALINEFEGFPKVSVGDPAGSIRAQTDERTCFQELLEAGILTEPANTNDFIPRREAVAFFLTKMADGQSGFLLDPSCRYLRKGFNGRYRYERLKTSGPTRYRDRPIKDDMSHIHDALQYACLKVRSGTAHVRSRQVVGRSAKGWT